jgi:signal transduction histidine kinase
MSVADDGCGMDADTLARACEPFFTTKGPGRGTGLGLATVFGVARQAGGCVTIESHAGAGTTVHVHVPAAVAVEAHFDLEAVR